MPEDTSPKVVKLPLYDDRGNEINLDNLKELFAAAREAFSALVGASAKDDSV